MIAYIGESLTAAGMLTLVRLLTGMYAQVNRQSVALNEALPAARAVASIRALVVMKFVMSMEIVLAFKALEKRSVRKVSKDKVAYILFCILASCTKNGERRACGQQAPL